MGLAGWPTLLLGDHAREFRHLNMEFRAGTNLELESILSG